MFRNPDPVRGNFILFGIAVALIFRKINIPSLVNGKKSAQNSATSIPTGSGFLKVRNPDPVRGNFRLFGIAVALIFRKINIPSLVNGKKSAQNSATSIPSGSGFLKVVTLSSAVDSHPLFGEGAPMPRTRRGRIVCGIEGLSLAKQRVRVYALG